MFIQPCYIKKNTPFLRSKLKEFGYKCNNGKWMGKYLATFKRDNDHDLFYCGTPEYDLINNPSLKDSIDCGENEELFLALIALRNDSDINQWFTDLSGHWYKCTFDNGNKFIFFHHNLSDFNAHKATVKELINHFKK